VHDHFAWMRDRDDPDTLAYLEAENAHAEAFFSDHTELVTELFEEIKSFLCRCNRMIRRVFL
jgi:oligopeptidase B